MWTRNSNGDNLYRYDYPHTSNGVNGLWQIFLKWKRSVMKLVWCHLLIFLLAFFTLKLLYYLMFPNETFVKLCIYCHQYMDVIPIQLLTGFYVLQVISRWWDMFMSLPFPDKVALKLTAYIAGNHHFQKNLRRTVMRYTNLSTVLVYRLVSKKVMKRFPDMQSLIDSKLLLPHEADRLEKVDMKSRHESSWTPILWALKLVQRARANGNVQIEAPVYANLVTSFDYIETSNRKILNYGWMEFPLVYTQVVTIAVYMYFAGALFGRQFIIPGEKHMDDFISPHHNSISSTSESFNTHEIYLPIFTAIQFICYMGWIKVAEQLLNPFGDDDEDFDINYLIDRNLQVSYLIVDEADTEIELAEDPFLEAGIIIPEDLPYQDDQDCLPRSNSKVSRDLSARYRKTPISLYLDGSDKSVLRGGRSLSTVTTSTVDTMMSSIATTDGNSPTLSRMSRERSSILSSEKEMRDVEEGIEKGNNEEDHFNTNDGEEENNARKQWNKLKKFVLKKDYPIVKGIYNSGFITEDIDKIS